MNGQPPDTDALDAAIAAAGAGGQAGAGPNPITVATSTGAGAGFFVDSGHGRKAVAVFLPRDLTESEAFAALGAVHAIMRQTTLAAEHAKKGAGLVAARGALPPAPIDLAERLKRRG